MINNKGISFMEIIIALSIGVVVITVLVRFTGTMTSLEDLINQRLVVQQDLNQAFQYMITEIRSALPSEEGSYPLVLAETSTIVFYSDYDHDGLVEKIRYSVSTNTLDKGIIEPVGLPLFYPSSTEIVSTIIPNLISSSSSFEYFEAGATSTVNPMTSVSIADVRMVGIIMTADVSSSSSPTPDTFIGTATIRNLRDK